MSQDINQVILIGRLTREAELKTVGNGTLCKFSLASKRQIYNKQSGESREEVGYFECTLWGKAGEALAKHTQKGSRVCVSGYLRWSSWAGSDGKKQSKVEIAVENFQFLNGKKDGAQTQNGQSQFDEMPF